MIELSVIIPTHNRIERLKRVLAGFEAQTYSRDLFEVIVVSDASSDGTNEYLAAFETPLDFHFVIQEHGGPAKARNSGVAKAQGKYVLFVDDDVVPSTTLIAEHMRLHHESDQRLVVLGPMLTPDDFDMAPWVRWEQAMLVKQYDAMEQGVWTPTARQFYTGNSSLAREHILAVGGFNESFRRAEDVELAYRLVPLNVKFVFEPRAIGYHYASRSFESWMSIPYAYGRNDAVFATSGGQEWLLGVVRDEFRQRHPLSTALVCVSLNRPLVRNGVIGMLRLVAALSNRLQVSALSQQAYSGIFSTWYYQGFVDQLGTTAPLFERRPGSVASLHDAR